MSHPLLVLHLDGFPSPPAPSGLLPVLCAGENPVLHKHLNPNGNHHLQPLKQILSVGYYKVSFCHTWFGESSRNRGRCKAVA